MSDTTLIIALTHGLAMIDLTTPGAVSSQLFAEVTARLLGGKPDVAVTVAEPNADSMGAPE